jgi:hypothetical protein
MYLSLVLTCKHEEEAKIWSISRHEEQAKGDARKIDLRARSICLVMKNKPTEVYRFCLV